MKQKNSFHYLRRSRWLLPVVMLFALLTSANTAWADKLIVNGTTTTSNTYIPLEGNYADTNGSRSEFILPESALEGMVGDITQMSFELVNSTSFTATYQVYLKIVDNTEFVYENYKRYFAGIEGSTTVYEGVLNGSSTTLNIEFNQNGGSFNYTGGNLLVGFLVTTKGSYESTSFKGVSGSNCALYSRSNGSQTGDNVNFLPKVTFTYTPSGAVVVPKPKNVTAGSITATGATIGWDAVDGADSYELSCSTSSVEPAEEGSYTPVNTNSYNITGLTGGSLYYVYVRTIKDGNHSKWSAVCSFTPGTLTINNVSTTTNYYVPIYGNYMDNHSRSQFIMPKASVTSLSGTQITKIVFYGTAGNTAKFANKTFDVYLKEVDDASISSLYDWASLEQVYSGNLTIIDGKMTITLDEGFDYSGDKNLLIGFNQTDDDKDYTSTEWTGISATGVSMGGYDSSISQRNFLPQTTFYFAPQTATVKKPKNLAASATTTTTATLGWTDGEEGLTAWEISYSTNADFDANSEGTKVAANANPFTLTELTAATTYYAYVRAKKGEEYSGWSNKASFTTLSAVPVIELSTTSHNFGMVSDADAQVLTLTISNTGGAALTGLTVTPTSGFAVTDKDGNALTTTEIAASSTLSVKVKLNALGQQDGTITIDGNEIDAQVVNVSGYMLDDTKICETFTSAAPDHWTEYAYKSTYSTYNWSYSADGAYNTNENSTLSTPKITVAESQTLVVYGKLKISATYGYILVEGSSDNGETWTAYSKKLDYEAFSNTTNVFQLITLSDVPTTVNKLRFKCYYAYLNTINGFTYAPDPVLALYSDEECTAAISTVVSKSFGLITEAQSENYYIKNTGTGQIDLTINEPTDFTATIDDAALTNNEVAKLTITMPATEGMHDDAIVVTAKNHDTDDVLGTFTVNATGALRDANKFYQEFNTTSRPEGWTADGTWSYNAANGAYTQAWYITEGTLARLKTPLLDVAAGEKFIIEAKGFSTSNTSYQHLVLQYSTDGTSWTAFSDDLGTAISTDPANWKTFTVTWPSEVEAGRYYIGMLASQADIRMFYGGESVSGANFAINTDGSTQDFGSVKCGATAQKSYTVTNSGNAELMVKLTADDGFTATGNAMLFTNTKGWSAVKVHAWDDGGNITEWPGVDAPYYGKNNQNEDQYVIVVPAGAKGIVINNGNGQQSSDITDFNKEGYYLSGDLYDGNKYWASSWGDAPSILAVAAGKSEQFTVTMNTATSGDKSGNVVLTFDALNATSFTIPCTGNVKDENYLFVDFEDQTYPENWQVGADWSIGTASSNHYAVQSNTKTASALVTTPLTMAENETLTFKAARNASGQGNETSLKTRYSIDGGATWSDYVNHSIEGTGLEEKSVTGVPAGTVIVEFLASNIKLDDIQGFTKTTAPALALTEGDVAVVNGSTKDFGILSATASATYVLKNTGNADLVSTLGVTEGFNFSVTATDEGVTKTDNTLTIPAGKTATIKVELTPGSTYGEVTGSLTIDSEGWVGDFVVKYTATLIDETDFVEDFANGMPAGWYNGGWTVSGGEAYVYSGTDKMLITEKLAVAAGKDVLSFDAKVYDGDDNQTLKVYTSEDRINWSEAKTFTLTTEVRNFSLDALTTDSYVMFEASNASVDNLTGVKKLDLPDHDLMFVGVSGLKTDYTPNEAVSATVQIANLLANAEENVYVWVYYRKSGQSFSSPWVTDGPEVIGATATKAISLSANAPEEEALYDVMIVVNTSNDNTQPLIRLYQYDAFNVAHVTSLAINSFEVAESPVQADADNEFAATFNVKVTNTGSTTLAAEDVSVTLTDTSDSEKTYTATWSAATSDILYMNTKSGDNDIAADCTLKAWCWNTDEDGVWSEFTNINDGFWSVDLQDKTNFIICRFDPNGTDSDPWNNVWNKSGNLSLANGNLVKFSSYSGETMNFSQESMTLLEPTMTTTLKVTVTGAAGKGGTYSYTATENVSNTTYSISCSVKVNPTTVDIAISEYGYATFASEYALDLDELPEGLEVFYVTENNIHTNSIGLTEAGGQVKEGTGLLLKGVKGNYKVYATKKSEATEIDGNLLVGCLEETVLEPNANIYVLSVGEGDRAEFQALSQMGATIPANRAYLKVNGAGSRLVINFDDVTGINAVENAPLTFENCYNLQGQKVENVKKGGLYIINGRKVVIK